VKQASIFLLTLIFATSGFIASAQTLQTLASFNGTNGADPVAALTLGSDGNFYGTTYYGGYINYYFNGGLGYGTVFKVTTNGTLTTLVSFNDTNLFPSITTNGINEINPSTALTLGTDGNFYGTTREGGSTNLNIYGRYGYGTVFKVTTNGTLTTLLSFNNTNGAYPGPLTLGTDGNFYGTTQEGGSTNLHFYGQYGYGTVFKVTTNGTLTTLLSFNNTNGANAGALTLGTDGNFYGTTQGGGSSGNSGWGTVFKVTTNGTLATLVSFNDTNGAGPVAALMLGADGSFYGTTSGSGSGVGTLFNVSTNGTLITLFSFNSEVNWNGLLLGSDGNFYGTTQFGGNNGEGSVFMVTTNGLLNTVFSFNVTNGYDLTAGLTLGNDSNFYGTTCLGGSGGGGTLFRLLLPPLTTVQPQNQTNNAGATVTFLVSAASLHPLSYQWQKNATNLIDGGNISGANTNTLTITGISDSDAATYLVTVSNANGSVTSSNATLTVIDPPIITAQPPDQQVLAGTNVTFGVSLTGSASFFQYQWLFNGTNILNATNSTYTISSVATTNAGNYFLIVTNLAGIVTTSNAALTVVLSPNSRTNYAGSTATFTGTAFSPELLNYQWQKNGTNLVNGGNLSGATNSSLTIANVSDADAAIYNLVVSDATGSVTTSNATLTVNDLPIIATQPLSQAVGVGSNVTFTATAYGASPLVFQWYFGNSPVGSPITGTNVSSYTLTNVQTNQFGNYSVQVFNGYDSATSSNAVLTLIEFAPNLTTQPTNQTVLLGRSASFTVSANGSAPFQYQWRFNSANIPGATNSIYMIPAVVATNTGNYSVTVTNSAGGVISSNAMLTVIVPPVVSFQFLAGYPQLNLNGMLSSNFIVQYSTNLAGTNWINLRSVSNLSSSPYQFLDPAGIVPPARFYRALMQ
jgi:uncharacterized repeat protein (TIGR03803 family)